MIDDRSVYRPGETASFTGWVRRLTTSGDAQLQLLEAGARVDWTVSDGRGSTLDSGDGDAGSARRLRHPDRPAGHGQHRTGVPPA